MGSGTSRRARTRLSTSRRRLAAGFTAAVGMTLVAPVLVTAPAHAGLELPDLGGIDVGGVVTDPSGTVIGILDPVGEVLPLTPPTPVIAPGGDGGSITFLGAVVCSADGTVTKTCDALSLAGLDPDALTLDLVAVPATPGQVPTWDPATCPEPLADVCTIPLEDLVGSTPLAPVVSFLPGTAEAPDTKITSAVPGKQRTTHTFTFEAVPASETATFECKLQVTYRGTPSSTAPKSDTDWRLCESGMTYRNLANGDYVFAVRAVEEEVADESPATQTWRTSVPPEVPETRITGGPKASAWVLENAVTYTFKSSVPGSQFQCELGGLTYACDDGSFTVRGLTKGSHLFEVYAMANKTRDFTPAKRAFHVPLDDRALKPSGSWASKKQKGHFKNTYRESTSQGAVLVTQGTQKFRRIALVADKGRGHGTVKVFWNKKLLKEVSLAAKRDQKRRVIPVKSFTGKIRQGTLRLVVVSSGKVVRIDGLGIASR